jgi:replication factor C large subunit
MKSYIQKYCPAKISEVIGQEKAVKDLKEFIINFSRQRKKSAFIYGSTGIGKTCSVYAIANELGLEVFEINASEFRNKEEIKQKLGSAINQRSLFSKGKIILVDEVDGLSGTKDRGGLQEVIRLIKTTTFPIVLAANNPWENKFSSLRSKTNLIKFEDLDYNDIYDVLKSICSKENIKYDDNSLKSLSRMVGGDLRAGINDLQQLSVNSGKLGKEELNTLSHREKQDTMITALTKIFKTTDPKIALGAFDNVDEALDQQLLWLDKNLPEEYINSLDLARAYDCLSKADIFSRRIRRWQHWRFLVYINALITGGVAVAKDKKYDKFVAYKPTGRLLKIYWANIKNMKRKAIALKIAQSTHSSQKQILKNMDYYRIIFQKNKNMAAKIAQELDLDKEEVSYLKK